jgi:tricarballylate dehydrogenase
MVNLHGKRFVDEGETWRGLTYAKMGRAILAQPRGVAFQIFDSKHRDLDVIRGYDKATVSKSNTLGDLASQLGVTDIPTFLATIRDYNDAVQPGEFGAFRPDGVSALGIEPPRRNWALKLDTPPYEGFPVVCGMTFCYGGLKTTATCQVTHTMDRPIPGLYAVGEMLGGLWHWNYPSGGGMMAGAVFGRIAGIHAAAEALA